MAIKAPITSLPTEPVAVLKGSAESDMGGTNAEPAAGKRSIVPDGYEGLAEVLMAALQQASGGKGRERHADDKPFMEQPIITLGRMTGEGGTAFQAMKKTREALGMVKRGNPDAAQAELLGAIVYTAATYLLIGEKKVPA